MRKILSVVLAAGLLAAEERRQRLNLRRRLLRALLLRVEARAGGSRGQHTGGQHNGKCSTHRALLYFTGADTAAASSFGERYVRDLNFQPAGVFT